MPPRLEVRNLSTATEGPGNAPQPGDVAALPWPVAATIKASTLHIDKAPFHEAPGIANEKKIYLFMVAPAGQILLKTEGSWSEE